jgi:hypothetical protein
MWATQGGEEEKILHQLYVTMDRETKILTEPVDVWARDAAQIEQDK